MKKTINFKVGDEVTFEMSEVVAFGLNITHNKVFTIISIDDDLIEVDKPAAYDLGKSIHTIHKDYFKLIKSPLSIFYEENF